MSRISKSRLRPSLLIATPAALVTLALLLTSLLFGSTGPATAADASPHDPLLNGQEVTAVGDDLRAAVSPRTSSPDFAGQVSAGGNVTCVITTDQRVVCWGDDANGIVSGASAVTSAVQVSVGFEHACAVKSDTTVFCWGAGLSGSTTVPAGLGNVKKVATAMEASCSLSNSGIVTCWGTSANGLTTPPSFSSTPVDISGGDLMFCALLASGSATCWGLNDGAGRVSGASAVTAGLAIDSGRAATCTIVSGGTLTCWGFGDGRFSGATSVTQAVQVSVGQSGCALNASGTLQCFGTYLTAPPASIQGARHSYVAVGDQHACTVSTSGALTCWGNNSAGQATPPPGLTVSQTARSLPPPTPASPSPSPTSTSPSPSPTPQPTETDLEPDEEVAYSLKVSRIGSGAWRIKIETADPRTTFTVIATREGASTKLVWRNLVSDDNGEFSFRTTRNLKSYRVRLIVDGAVRDVFIVR